MNRKTGVILSYVLMVFEILSTLFLTPLIIKNFGQAEYGVYKFTFSITAYLLLLDFGVGNSIVKYVAKFQTTKDYDQERKFFGITIIFYFIVSIVAAICCGCLIYFFPSIFATGFSPEEIVLAQKLLLIVSLNIVITLLTSPFNYILNGRSQYTITRGFSIMQIIVRILLSYAALLAGYKSIAIALINLATTFFCRVGYILYIFLKLKILPLFTGINRNFIKEIVGYSAWIFVQMIATQINSSADEVLIGYIVPNASIIISVYGIGGLINQYFQSIGSAFTGVLMPGVVNLVESKSDSLSIQNEMIRIGRIILSVLIAIFGGFLIYGKQFIMLWAGGEYSDAYYVSLLLIFANMFILTQSIGPQILWAMNKHKEQAILKLSIVLLNIILTVFLIKWNPLFGATIGTFISLILGDIFVMNLIFKKRIGISLTKYYCGLLKGILPSFIIVLILNSFFYTLNLSGWIGFIVNILVYCLTYFITMLFIGFNNYEKNLIKRVFHKQE